MVTKLAAGTPFTVSNSGGFGDLNFDGFTEIRPALADKAVLGRLINDPGTSVAQLPREAFRAPAITDYGCCILGRNTFFLDGVHNWDFGLFKSFPLPFENHKLIVRTDLLNAFNHVQFGFPSVDLAATTFGRIVGTAVQYGPRTVQFSLRYTF
jgi:hypothetical protein